MIRLPLIVVFALMLFAIRQDALAEEQIPPYEILQKLAEKGVSGGHVPCDRPIFDLKGDKIYCGGGNITRFWQNETRVTSLLHKMMLIELFKKNPPAFIAQDQWEELFSTNEMQAKNTYALIARQAGMEAITDDLAANMPSETARSRIKTFANDNGKTLVKSFAQRNVKVQFRTEHEDAIICIMNILDYELSKECNIDPEGALMKKKYPTNKDVQLNTGTYYYRLLIGDKPGGLNETPTIKGSDHIDVFF